MKALLCNTIKTEIQEKSKGIKERKKKPKKRRKKENDKKKERDLVK